MVSMRRNVFLRASLQAMMMTGGSLLVATSALVGARLAPDASLATVPFAVQVLTGMLTTARVSLLMRRIGRRGGFWPRPRWGPRVQLAAFSILRSSFPLFVAAAALSGAVMGFGAYYRFAAAEVSTDEFRSRAISWVLAGGVVAAFAGPISDTAFVIQWHVLGMFGPSFFTGTLIRRYGVLRVMMAGAFLGGACVAINLAETSVWHAAAALALMGIGWNVLFIGGTTLLTESYRPDERASAQAASEFLILGTAALAVLVSGRMQVQLGWRAVNLSVLPMLMVAMLAIARLECWAASQPERNLTPG